MRIVRENKKFGKLIKYLVVVQGRRVVKGKEWCDGEIEEESESRGSAREGKNE